MQQLLSARDLRLRNFLGLTIVAVITLIASGVLFNAQQRYVAAVEAHQHVNKVLLGMLRGNAWAADLAEQPLEEHASIAYRGKTVLRETEAALFKFMKGEFALTPAAEAILSQPVNGRAILARFCSKLRDVIKAVGQPDVGSAALKLRIHTQSNAIHIVESLADEIAAEMHRQSHRLWLVALLTPAAVLASLMFVAFLVFAPMRRTILKHQRKLAKALDRAEAANVVKDRFLNSICHQLRTPMNGILGTAEMLDCGRLDGHERTLVGALRKSGERMHRVLEQVISYCELVSDKGAAKAVRVSLVDIVERELGRTQETHADRQLDMAAQWLGPVPGELLADPTRIGRLLAELFDNAARHAPVGGKMRFQGRAEMADGQAQVRIVVMDNGRGVAAEDRALVFERFEKGREAGEADDPGIGLGLTICREIVAQMSGTISLTTAPCGGAMVCVEFALPMGAPLGGTQTPASRAVLEMAPA